MRRLILLPLTALILALVLPACRSAQMGYVSDRDQPGLDRPAMGLGLDRNDLQRLFQENLHAFVTSRFYQRLEANPPQPAPTVAIMTMENWTSEHIEPQLHALLGMVETVFVDSDSFTVVAAALRERLLEELRTQQGQEFDRARAATLGRQLGVHYFLTGRVVDNSERVGNARRVQYFMVMQLLEVETGAVVWQNNAELSKGLVPIR